jgi:hypothetical protein
MARFHLLSSSEEILAEISVLGASDGKIWQAELKTLDFASWRKKS